MRSGAAVNFHCAVCLDKLVNETYTDILILRGVGSVDYRPACGIFRPIKTMLNFKPAYPRQIAMTTQTLPLSPQAIPEPASQQREVPKLLPEDLAYFTTISNSPLFSLEHAKRLFEIETTDTPAKA